MGFGPYEMFSKNRKIPALFSSCNFSVVYNTHVRFCYFLGNMAIGVRFRLPANCFYSNRDNFVFFEDWFWPIMEENPRRLGFDR